MVTATSGLLRSAAVVSLDDTSARVALVLVVVLSTAAAVLVNVAGSLGQGWAVLRANGRALLQLLVVALIIAAVLDSLALTFAFLLLMATVASVTAGRRLTRERSGLLAFLPVLAGSVPALLLVLVTGLVPLEGTALVPIGGILVGGAMTATVLAGRRCLDALTTRWGEYEAGVSIGLSSRDSALLVARDDAALALVPGLDQTRTVGLVTLPGAFVGMLLGGASPVDAAAVQLVVLVALLMVQSVAVMVAVELIARGWLTGIVPRVGR
ncbi:ABC transporter permease [Angustibacter luteus]|uniref:ABC transporter permease n=1 Tax=Angustibacter luteus TaxID=658456 RepID=A0ABW1J988_9ACTN